MYRVTRDCGQRRGAVPFAEQTTKDCRLDCSTKGGSYEEASGGVRSLMQEQDRLGPPPAAAWNAYVRW